MRKPDSSGIAISVAWQGAIAYKIYFLYTYGLGRRRFSVSRKLLGCRTFRCAV